MCVAAAIEMHLLSPPLRLGPARGYRSMLREGAVVRNRPAPCNPGHWIVCVIAHMRSARDLPAAVNPACVHPA